MGQSRHSTTASVHPRKLSFTVFLSTSVLPLLFLAFIVHAVKRNAELKIQFRAKNKSSLPQPDTKIIRSKSPTPRFPFESAYEYFSSSPLFTKHHRSIAVFRKHVISNYVRFHHNENTRDKCERAKCLISRVDESPTHGLGDHLRAIVMAYFLSVMTNRVFLIDWNFPVPITHVLYPWTNHSQNFVNFTYAYDPKSTSCCCCRFPLTPTHNDLSEVSRKEHARLITNASLYDMEKHFESIHSLYMDSVTKPDLSRWFAAPVERIKSNRLLRVLSKKIDPPLPSPIAIPLILQTLFTPSNELRAHIQKRSPLDLLEPPDMDRRSYIAVHARLGYFEKVKSEDQKRFDLSRRGLSVERMAECFASKVHFKSAPETDTVFVATDTPRFRPPFITHMKVLRKEMKVRFIEDFSPVHVMKIGPKKSNQLMDTFVDLFLLSRARIVVHMRSGFSNLAIWMGCLQQRSMISQEECATSFAAMGNNSSGEKI